MSYNFVLIDLYPCNLETKIVGCYKWEIMLAVSVTCVAVGSAAWTLNSTYTLYNTHIN